MLYYSVHYTEKQTTKILYI